MKFIHELLTQLDEQRFDEPLSGYHIVYRKSGLPVFNTPSFETQDQAQKYLMNKMFSNHQDYKVVHTSKVGLTEALDFKKEAAKHMKDLHNKSSTPVQREYAKKMLQRALEADKMKDKDAAAKHYLGNDAKLTEAETGYDEVTPKSASYILRKMEQGVPMSKILVDFPELGRRMEIIAGELGLHPDDDFEDIEAALYNELEDLVESGKKRQGVAEGIARGPKEKKLYELLEAWGYFITLKTSKIANDAIDNNASQELRAMQRHYLGPVMNGMTMGEILKGDLWQNHKVIPHLLKYIYLGLPYIEERIKKFVKSSEQQTYLSAIEKIKQLYKEVVAQYSQGQNLKENSIHGEFGDFVTNLKAKLQAKELEKAKAYDKWLAQQQTSRMPERKTDIEALKRELDDLESQFDPNFEQSDDHGFYSRQKRIQTQISVLRDKLKSLGVTEADTKNVVKSIKVGNFRHDLVDTGMGWQVRIYNGDELYDTGMSKNSEQKGLAALEDSVAYTEKQIRTKRQGVAEASEPKVLTPALSSKLAMQNQLMRNRKGVKVTPDAAAGISSQSPLKGIPTTVSFKYAKDFLEAHGAYEVDTDSSRRTGDHYITYKYRSSDGMEKRGFIPVLTSACNVTIEDLNKAIRKIKNPANFSKQGVTEAAKWRDNDLEGKTWRSPDWDDGDLSPSKIKIDRSGKDVDDDGDELNTRPGAWRGKADMAKRMTKKGLPTKSELGFQDNLKMRMRMKKKQGGLTGPKGPLPEEQGVEEAQFWGNKELAKQANDASDSKITIRGRDKKGVYTATLIRKKGESEPKEVSRVYEQDKAKADNLLGTPVISLSDITDKDFKNDKYGRKVSKKLEKDDPRVSFYKVLRCPKCNSDDVKTYQNGEKECKQCHKTWDSQDKVTEAIKGWKHAHSDIMKSRADAAKESMSVKLVKLKKDGTESKMHDAISYFKTEKEARDKHDYIVKINPGKLIAHNLYVGDKVERLG